MLVGKEIYLVLNSYFRFVFRELNMVDTAVVARGGVVKHLPRPRPLRTDPDKVSLIDILKLVDEVCSVIQSKRSDINTRKKVQHLKELLRLNGQAVEKFNKESLNKLEKELREACFDLNMDIVTRLAVLEIIELRLNNWVSNPVMANMYKQRLAEAQLDIDMKNIGYEGGIKEADHNQNSISSKINPKKGAAGDSNTVEVGAPSEFSSRLIVNGHTVSISSTCEDLVATSKDVLTEFFSIKAAEDDEEKEEEEEESTLVLVKPEISYEKNELIRMSKSPLCRDAPGNWDEIMNEVPFIVKKQGAPSKHFLRSMEKIKLQEAARKM